MGAHARVGRSVCRAVAEPELLLLSSWARLRPPCLLLAPAVTAAAEGAAAYCPSPRPRRGAAPARPAGEPGEPHVSWVMKLSPQQAPLYGDCVVTVLLAEEDKVEDDAIFYLIFSGSTLYHCTSTRKVSSDTLETIAPGHDCCETVKVLLCASREGLPVFVVAEEDFHFVQDEAYDAAQFLATSAGNQQALNFTRFLDRSGPPSRDVNSLDEKVALAFRHLKLPAEWNVLGTDHTLHDGGPRETLMHFAVRLGLLRLTWFLLQKPGGRGALSIHNKEGATPVSLALERGYHELHQLLTEENLASCAKVKMKQPKGSLQAHDTSSLPTVIMRNKSSQPKERPRSAVLLADEATAAPMFTNRRSQQSVSLSKSVSIQNITGVGNDENMSNTWKFLSHSTDSLNKICKVNESTESLTDEGVGTDMNEGQLMGDFESDSKQLEAESWSRTVDSKFLKQQKKDVVSS